MLLFGCVVAVLLGAVLWVVVTGVVARARLNDVRGEIKQLRAAVSRGDTPRAQSILAHVTEQTASAHQLTSGPAWWVGANLPLLGTPLRTARTVSLAAHRVAEGAPALLDAARAVAAPRDRSGVDLPSLRRASSSLARTVTTVGAALGAVRASQASWLPVVSGGRTDMLSTLTRVHRQLDEAHRLTGATLSLLGDTGPRRYFIGFMNEAESRGLGGVPGTYAIAIADHGQVRFERFGSDTDLLHVQAKVSLSPDYKARYDQDDPVTFFPNSDISPNFPDAARIWAGVWQAKTGEHIDGAIAMDPTALSYLLAVTGPAQLSGGASVTSRNVVNLTQSGQYVRYPGKSTAQVTARKHYLDAIARAVALRLLHVDRPQRLAQALTRAAGEHRLVMWDADAGVERDLAAVDWAGILGPSPGRTYSQFVINNAAGSKLDYYLSRSMTYHRSDCAAAGVATATFTLTNAAPRSGLPEYVTIRADQPHAKVRPGDNRLLVTYYAASAAAIKSVTLDGKAVPLVILPEGNTVSTTVDVELPAGKTRKLVVTVREPATDRPVQIREQPGVYPLTVSQTGAACR